MSAPLQKGTEVIAGETPHFLEDSWRQSPPSPYESRLCRPPGESGRANQLLKMQTVGGVSRRRFVAVRRQAAARSATGVASYNPFLGKRTGPGESQAGTRSSGAAYAF